ncbi:SPOR domain-containing protein [uncultured Rhodospira sp.]|uniref:SPOR domain-containing protein n=1 Tax=uncultured Rhodospira sp. TaxID=1936189 RepID=UPI002635AFCB|nr:SPOR domain-containing protein [uncultured Rhodospira sp.]
MSGLRKARRDGREEPIALDDEMFRVVPDDDPEELRDGPAYDPIDDLDLDLEGGDEPGAAPRRRSGGGRALWLTLLGLVVLAGGGWAAWVALQPVPPTSSGTGELMATIEPAPVEPEPSLPTVRAEDEPFKIKPDDPGGLRVENTDKRVYERVGEGARVESGPGVEQLLPAPVRPVAPPRPPEPVAEPVAEPEGAGEAPAPTEAATAEDPDETAGQQSADPVEDTATAVPAPEPEEAPAPPAEAEAPAPAPDPEVAEAPPAPGPTPTPAPTPAPAPAENVAAVADQGPQVQLAAFRERGLAEKQWTQLRDAHPDLLGDVPHVIVYADLGDLGQFYRLRAGPLPDAAAAETLCRDLRRRDVECLVVRD